MKLVIYQREDGRFLRKILLANVIDGDTVDKLIGNTCKVFEIHRSQIKWIMEGGE